MTTAFFGDVDDDQFRSLTDGLERAASRSHVGLLTLANATEFNGKTLVLEVARSRDLSPLVLPLIGSRTGEWDPVELVLMDSRAGARTHYVPLASRPLAAGLSA